MSVSEAVIDLAAISSNTARIVDTTKAQVMAVVKADGYGHGAVPTAQAALAGGATWLAVCTIDEALQLRREGITAPVLSWLHNPGEPWESALRADVDLSVSTAELLAEVIAVARAIGITARLHLKADTGLSRGGASATQWPDLVTAAAKAAAECVAEVVGIWSHFACADSPGHPSIAAQLRAFDQALESAADQGVRPQLRHMANSAAALTLPQSHYDLIRPGISIYGYSPMPHTQARYGLRPAMTLRAQVMLLKGAPAGTGVSYGHNYTTTADTTLALVPLGYADGVPRAAGNCGPLQLGEVRRRIAGRVSMDQFVVDLGQRPGNVAVGTGSDHAVPVRVGHYAVLFGPGDEGEPTADDWAELLGTISYEMLSRIGPRVRRIYLPIA